MIYLQQSSSKFINFFKLGPVYMRFVKKVPDHKEKPLSSIFLIIVFFFLVCCIWHGYSPQHVQSSISCTYSPISNNLEKQNKKHVVS